MMIRLKNIIASPHPSGNRIDLEWENPDPMEYPGICIRRCKGAYPVSPEDGDLVVRGIVNREAPNPFFVFMDDGPMDCLEMDYSENEKGEGKYHLKNERNLQAETVYYYSLFPYKDGDTPAYEIDTHNRISSMATGPYNISRRLYELLPGIYHRYDKILPKVSPGERMLEEDKQRGQLQRFLDLPGMQLDQIYSFAKALLDLHNIDKVNGHLLPLLAQWIGWDLDLRKEIADQRKGIGNAPYIYKTIGLISTAEATVKRIIGWENRAKEFIQNIFLTNHPERLNIWVSQRNSNGGWSEPKEPLSLNFAYEGRPTATSDGNGKLWLFYHTCRKAQWDIRNKIFSKIHWDIWYKTYGKDQGWSPSQPLTNRGKIDKYPTAVFQGSRLWLFWTVYDETEEIWHISGCTYNNGEWSKIKDFYDYSIERKKPWAVADNMGYIWLFWSERGGKHKPWQLKYKRFHGTENILDLDLTSALDFPSTGGSSNPGIESDVFVLSYPSDSLPYIWVFWARKEPMEGLIEGNTNEASGNIHKEMRWTIQYRIKEVLDTSVYNDAWSEIFTLPKDHPDCDDREPAAYVDEDGNIELFWGSNRGGSWSVWGNTLEISSNGEEAESGYQNWGSAEQVTKGPYSQHDPMPIAMDHSTLLIYRSSECLRYTSNVYKATETLDSRYAGCTSVDTRNIEKNALYRDFEDFNTYTYDAGQNGERNEQCWYARDCVGIYLTPDIDDQRLFIQNKMMLNKALKKFLPIQVQTIFVIEPTLYKEIIYDDSRLIIERFFDDMTCTKLETYPGLVESYKDIAPGWIWFRSWSEENPDHRTVLFTDPPKNTEFRTWHSGIEAGG